MTRFILQRAIRAAVLFVVIVNVVFLVTNVLGDPVARSLPVDASPEQHELRAQSFGLDQPLAEQYTDYITGAFALDFGDSFTTDTPAMEKVRERLPRTFLLVGASMALALLVGVPTGIALGVTKRRWVDKLGNWASLIALSLPQFWFGILIVLVFAVHLGWLPTSGIGGWRHLVLPAVTLSVTAAGRTLQITQTTLREELEKPYIRTANAKGLSTRRVLVHAMRNVSVPVTTVFAYEAVTALAGYTILVETVFAWPGIGLLLVESVAALDIPLVAAAAVTVSLIVVVGNALVDILYQKLDPRIALEA